MLKGVSPISILLAGHRTVTELNQRKNVLILSPDAQSALAILTSLDWDPRLIYTHLITANEAVLDVLDATHKLNDHTISRLGFDMSELTGVVRTYQTLNFTFDCVVMDDSVPSHITDYAVLQWYEWCEWVSKGTTDTTLTVVISQRDDLDVEDIIIQNGSCEHARSAREAAGFVLEHLGLPHYL